MAHIRVAPAGLTLPGRHAEFVFRLPKHKTTLATAVRESTKIAPSRRQTCGGIGGRFSAQMARLAAAPQKRAPTGSAPDGALHASSGDPRRQTRPIRRLFSPGSAAETRIGGPEARRQNPKGQQLVPKEWRNGGFELRATTSTASTRD